jgi:hypothetical protein
MVSVISVAGVFFVAVFFQSSARNADRARRVAARPSFPSPDLFPGRVTSFPGSSDLVSRSFDLVSKENTPFAVQ